jgi:thioredoxin-like negative regulator of GroEL
MRVDIEEQPELAERFRVAAVPALVLVKGKRIVDRIDGRCSAPKIGDMLASHLAAAAAWRQTGSRPSP